jgi:hypothetical protein
MSTKYDIRIEFSTTRHFCIENIILELKKIHEIGSRP